MGGPAKNITSLAEISFIKNLRKYDANGTNKHSTTILQCGAAASAVQMKKKPDTPAPHRKSFREFSETPKPNRRCSSVQVSYGELSITTTARSSCKNKSALCTFSKEVIPQKDICTKHGTLNRDFLGDSVCSTTKQVKLNRGCSSFKSNAIGPVKALGRFEDIFRKIFRSTEQSLPMTSTDNLVISRIDMRTYSAGDPFWKAPSTPSDHRYKITLPEDVTGSSLCLRMRFSCDVKIKDLNVGFKISNKDDVEERKWSLTETCALGSVHIWEVVFHVPRGSSGMKTSRHEIQCEVKFYSGEAVIVAKNFNLNY